MLAMALELAQYDDTYEDIASKFFEHFVHIADAMNTLGGMGLWHEDDGFYYDQLQVDDDGRAAGHPLDRRHHPAVRRRGARAGRHRALAWLPQAHGVVPQVSPRPGPAYRVLRSLRTWRRRRIDTHDGAGMGHRLLAIPSRERLERVLRYLLDESEFLSPHGVRALSRFHRDHPFVLWADGQEHRVDYAPGESTTGLFGGNSNWRGPIWFPVNYLLIEALERYHHFYGDEVRVECPTGSGQQMNLFEASQELRRRLANLFLPDAAGRRPCHGDDERYASDPHWRDFPLFYEYFHGDTAAALAQAIKPDGRHLSQQFFATFARQLREYRQFENGPRGSLR